MCVCDTNKQTPYCDSFECQEALKNTKKVKQSQDGILLNEPWFIFYNRTNDNNWVRLDFVLSR